MEITIHYPNTSEGQAELSARYTRLHTEYVAQYIEKMRCPTEQKLQLIDAIVKTILDEKSKE